MPAEPPWVHWGQWRTGFWEPDAPPDGEDNMRRHRSASFSTPGRAGNISLWYLIAAFMAGLALLHLIAPTEARAQTSADSTAVLHWTAPGDDGTTGRATSYALRYRSSAISGTDTLGWWNVATQATGLPVPGVSGSTDSVRVRGLIPLTTYYFVVRTADEVPNWSGFSNVAVVTTSGDAIAPAAIADLSITGSTGNSISVRWTAPGDDNNTGTATSYDIRYSTSAITASNWASATTVTGEPTPLVAGTVQNYTVTGLQGSQTYYVAIRASDERSNVSGLSNVVNGSTLDTIPPAPVRDLSYGDAGYWAIEQIASAEF